VPYLVTVDSPWDVDSPYYDGSYTISEEALEQRIIDVYGIWPEGDPENWIEIDEDALADGGYVGRVSVCGYDRSQGGTAGTAAITGRSIREKLLGFALRSTCFTVRYHNGKLYLYHPGLRTRCGTQPVRRPVYGAGRLRLSGYSDALLYRHGGLLSPGEGKRLLLQQKA
jgi:hypothetical protein